MRGREPSRWLTRIAVGALLALLASAAGGCSAGRPGGDVDQQRDDPSVVDLGGSEAPTGAPLSADLRQSSRDAARGQVQVWLRNDTGGPLTPTRLVYRDDRLVRDVPAERLRTVPGGTELGFPVPLPAARCPVGDPAVAGSSSPSPGRLTVVWDGGRRTVAVTDDNDTVARHAADGCAARRVAEVARLSFAEEVPVTGRGAGARARLLLDVRPTGRAGAATLVVRAVGGTPVLVPADGRPVWRLGLRVSADDAARRVGLPVAPARCDAHAFLEAGGATAFRVELRLAEPGRAPVRTQLVVRMPPAGARAAIDHALEACGLTD